MSIALAVFAAMLALYAFGCYRAGAYFGPFYQWRTREEYPHQFWFVMVVNLCVSLFFAFMAIYSAIHGQ